MISIRLGFDVRGLDSFEVELAQSLAEVKRRTLQRSLRLMSQSVDQAFQSRGYPSGSAIGPSSGEGEPKKERVGRWAKHRPSTVRSRELWAKRTGQQPAGEELRLTDALRRAATDTTGSVEGSAAFLDEAAGEAGIGVTLDVFPGARALQWGYAPRRLAARPFLAITRSVEREIQSEAEKDLSLAASQLSRQFSR